MKKHILAIVVGGNQLLFAIQAKHTIHSNDEFDIVYRNIDIDENETKKIFDNVYKSKSNDAPPKWNALRCFLNPEYAVKKYYADIDLNKYTDILFWHADWLHYFLYKYSYLKKHKYNWHLLPEGLGAYIIGGYEISSRKKYGHAPISKLIEYIDNKRYGYPEKAANVVEDAYYIQAKYALTKDLIRQIDMPPFDTTDKEYINLINTVLKYRHTMIKDKVIILDGGLGGSREDYYNPQKMDKIIEIIANKYGKENVLLKRKHGIEKRDYPTELINKVTDYTNQDMPWELICLNEDIVNSRIVSVVSSACILPFIFNEFNVQTGMIGDELLNYKYDDIVRTRFEEIYKMISDNNSNYSFISKEDEINV